MNMNKYFFMIGLNIALACGAQDTSKSELKDPQAETAQWIKNSLQYQVNELDRNAQVFEGSAKSMPILCAIAGAASGAYVGGKVANIEEGMNTLREVPLFTRSRSVVIRSGMLRGGGTGLFIGLLAGLLYLGEAQNNHKKAENLRKIIDQYPK